MVGLDRVELSTPRLSSACSNQLSYWPFCSRESVAPPNFKVRRALKAERQNQVRALLRAASANNNRDIDREWTGSEELAESPERR